MKGRRFIVTWLWMLALLLSGCFNPGYGAGGFLCEKGGCPPGYGCTCQQGKSVCIKGAPDSPCNKGADLGLDGPSGHMCDAIEEVVDEGLSGPATFDLTLDKNGNPFVVYADVYSSLHTKSKKRQDTSWPAQGMMVTALKTSRMAAAINQQDHLSVAFSAIDAASSGTKPTIHHTYLDLMDTTSGWQGLSNLDKDMGVEDLDLVGSLTEGSTLHLMVTGNTVAAGAPHVLVMELKPPAGGGPYNATPICKLPGGHFSSPRLTMGKHQGSLFTATALHDEDSKAWHVTRFAHGAVGCLTPSTIKGVALSSPLALAADGNGDTHLAYSQVETSSQKQKMGGLSCGVWPGSISSPPTNLPRVRQNVFVDSLSMDLVLAQGDRPCVTFWEYNDKKNVLELKISCMASKSSPFTWTDSAVVDTIDVPVSEFKGYATHSVVDKGGMVHVAYQHHTMKPSEKFSVRYTTCKP